MKDYKQIASEVLRLVGGEGNISSLVHCSTRLRFVLKDMKAADIEKLKKVNGVIGVVAAAQLQVIIGNDVVDVYEELKKMIHSDGRAEAAPQKGKINIGAAILDFIVGVFAPLVPAIAGAGMMKALLTILTMLHVISSDSPTYQVIFTAANAALYFLPILVAVSTAAKMSCNKMVAVAIVGVLLYPDLTASIASGTTLLGFPIQNISYGSQVFPPVLIVLLLAVVEKYATKVSPKSLRTLLVPMISFIIVVPLTLLLLDPLGYNIGSLISYGIITLYAKIGWVASALLAAALPVLISGGMHKPLLPYLIDSVSNLGYEIMYFCSTIAHNFAESGAAFAVAIRTKSEQRRSAAISGGTSALFGITEPAIYGVTIQSKQTLIAVSVASGIAGAFLGAVKVKGFVIVNVGLATLPAFIDADNPMNLIWAIAGMGVAFAAGFAMTFFTYQEEPPAASDDHTTRSDNRATLPVNAADMALTSHLQGKAIPLSEVKDEVFAAGILGDGMAVIPEKGELYAPADGIIDTVFDSKHAISMITDSGAELLMHVGMDTVKLEGKGYTPQVKGGDKVKKGQLLLKFDIGFIKSQGYDLTTPLVVTNGDAFTVKHIAEGTVSPGTVLMELEVVQ